MTVSTIQPIRKDVTVQASPSRAFEVFTEGMGRWWNRDHTIGSEPMATVVVEPREGGRWYEEGEQGAQCDWGWVLVWEPPARLVLAWQIGANWQFDPNLRTEVEVRFLAEGGSTTRVELEHRGLEALGPPAEAVRGIFDSAAGWTSLLERFTTALD